MNEASIISARGVTKEFDSGSGVFELELNVNQGSIVGFIGPSGSGKTTSVRLMTGLIQPDSGDLKVLGATPTEFDAQTRARIGYMPQNSVLYPNLSLMQNLQFAASLFGMARKDRPRLDELVRFVELEGAANRYPGEASGGEMRRIALASTFVHEPELIFLDEPTAGLDPVLRRKFWDRFGEIAESGRTLIVTTQYVGEAAYCDYIAVLDQGRTVTYDSPDGLRRSAYGGEPDDIVFKHRPTADQIEAMGRLSSVGPPDWLDGRSARLVFEDAGLAGPEIATWANERNIELEKTEAFVPPFDDVFVELIEQSAASDQVNEQEVVA